MPEKREQRGTPTQTDEALALLKVLELGTAQVQAGRSRGQPHHPVLHLRPAEGALFEGLGQEPPARSIPPDHLHPVGAGPGMRIPSRSRPPFRFDAAHHSDLIAPTVPINPRAAFRDDAAQGAGPEGLRWP